jgi:hypothetical protein
MSLEPANRVAINKSEGIRFFLISGHGFLIIEVVAKIPQTAVQEAPAGLRVGDFFGHNNHDLLLFLCYALSHASHPFADHLNPHSYEYRCSHLDSCIAK